MYKKSRSSITCLQYASDIELAYIIITTRGSPTIRNIRYLVHSAIQLGVNVSVIMKSLLLFLFISLFHQQEFSLQKPSRWFTYNQISENLKRSILHVFIWLIPLWLKAAAAEVFLFFQFGLLRLNYDFGLMHRVCCLLI